MTVLQGMAFGLMCLLVLVNFILTKRLIQRLELCHPARHAAMDLGSLQFVLRDSTVEEDSRFSAAFFKLQGFLWRGDYRRLGDPELTRLADRMRQLVVLFIALFAVFAATVVTEYRTRAGRTASPSSVVSAGQHADREGAYRLYRVGRVREAMAIFDVLLARPERDAEVLFWRAMGHAQLGQEDLALQDLQRLQEWEPANFEAHLQADRILTRARRWDEILALWDRFLAVEPGHGQAYEERGGAHFHRGDKPAALADARRACELGRGDACRQVKRLQDQP